MSTDKQVPRGKTWLYFHRLAVQTTDVSFQEFLASRGMEIPLDHFSVRTYADGASAKIALPHEIIEYLVNCVIGDERLHEHRVRAMLPETAGLHSNRRPQ